MKRIVSLILVCILMVGVLASCGSNVTEAYAKKINDAFKNDKALAYADVMDALGDEAFGEPVGTEGHEGGFVIAIKGVTNEEDLKELVKSSEEIEGLVVTFFNGKANYASYGTIPSKYLSWIA